MSEKTKIIAIDFDDTFTADVKLWQIFIKYAKSRGHICVCVTGRSDEGQWGAEVRREIGGLIPIVFAGRKWKRDAAKEAGFDVDIWIDDNPEYIAEQGLLKTLVLEKQSPTH